MKTKDQQLLEEAYSNINEGIGSTVSIEVPTKLWKAALNAHKLPNSNEVLAKIMGDIVNRYVKNQKKKEQENRDYLDYWDKREMEGTGF